MDEGHIVPLVGASTITVMVVEDLKPPGVDDPRAAPPDILTEAGIPVVNVEARPVGCAAQQFSRYCSSFSTVRNASMLRKGG